MSDWSFVDVWRTIAGVQAGAVALEQGERRWTWGEFAHDFDALGSYLDALGLPPQSTVALYMYNSPEYLLGFAGALAAGLVPINTNYRYGEDELRYLFENADARVVVFHGAFVERLDTIRASLTGVVAYVFVDDATSGCPSWAVPFDETLRATPRGLAPQSGAALMMLYTGGTTGMPKGVMWRQDDLFVRLNSVGALRYPDEATLEDVARMLEESDARSSILPACPLMHGTGLFTSLRVLAEGGRVALLQGRSYDAFELVEALERGAIERAVIVGDSFARPLLRVLREYPARFSLGDLRVIASSGAMWSEEIKRGLIEMIPHVLLADAFASSEALGMGSSVSSKDRTLATAQFTLGESCRVVAEDGTDVEPGSEQVGQLMVAGRNPLGYYRDEEKSARTFPVIDGVRYVVPGDMAKLRSDGTLVLLGRGSQCINTAGEKVFPEEVEESLKTHPSVADACVVGVSDEHYGQRIVAAVELHPGESTSEGELIAHVKARLASYKAPRTVRFVASIGRAVNGKLDYRRHLDEAVNWVASLEA